MKRKPRALDAKEEGEDPPVTASALTERAHALWLRIRTEYVTSPEAPTIEGLARKYKKSISYEAIVKRAKREGWSALREDYWTKAEVALLARIQDQYLSERIEDMKKIRQASAHVFEHLMPVTDPKTGEIKRDPDTGMPIFRHPFRSQEGVVKTFLLLQERMMLLRGEAIMRSESAIRDRQGVAEDEDDPLAVMAAKANFSREELRVLAREMLKRRTEAEEAEEEEEDDFIDAEAEEDSDGDEI